MPHNLTLDNFVELSFSYDQENVFGIFSFGDSNFDSSNYIFNIVDIGYTGTTFYRWCNWNFLEEFLDPNNILETRSKYFVKKNRIIYNEQDIIVTKTGFELNSFSNEKKLEYSSITPNDITRISQKTSSLTYNVTLAKDLLLSGLTDNHNRPVSEVFLSIVNKGYSGYFNKSNNGVGLKQGWVFNLTNQIDSWWSELNQDSYTNIPVDSYTLTNGTTETFYYNRVLNPGDLLDGDFCEWNDYEQMERVVSPYYQKIKYNQNVFQTTTTTDQNSPGFYYAPHNKMTLRVFSDYIETGDIQFIDQVPSFSYFSKSDQQFRWRDLYTFGFKDNLERGVDYPFFNSAQYPFTETVFRLIPEGINFNSNLLGINYPIKPLIDGCEIKFFIRKDWFY